MRGTVIAFLFVAVAGVAGALAFSALTNEREFDRLIANGDQAVADEQDFVRSLASRDPADKRALMVDLYKRVIDGVVDLGFPLSIHFEATYGVSGAAFETFSEMLAYWSPDR